MLMFRMPTERFALARFPASIDDNHACPLSIPPHDKFNVIMKVALVPPTVVPRMRHGDKCSDALSWSGLGAHDMHMHAVACPGMLSTKAYQNHVLDLSIKAKRASSACSLAMPVDEPAS